LRLILASASPRRREILDSLGVRFEVVVPDVEEVTEGPPEELVVENARRKARVGLRAAGEEALVLGVDTEVFLDGRALGKAGNRAEARDRLERLSGRTHTVLSGLVLLAPGQGGGGPEERAGVARSAVTFVELDESTLDLYLSSGEWRDRAGAYAVQGLGSILVDRVDGDLSNVIGLPLGLLLEIAPSLVPPNPDS
jgi:septum formation protein